MEATSPRTKLEALQALLRQLEQAAVAFSGGVDSTLLLAVACQTLGEERILALTARSQAFPEWEQDESKRLAEQLGVRQIFVPTGEITLQGYSDNPPTRCYHCKSEMYGRFWEVAREHGHRWLLDGATVDDLQDYRPGARAAKEQQVRHPLTEVGLNKSEIRQLARELELPTWDKPAFSCLSSRFPYGEKITPEKLQRVARAEAAVREITGLGDFRVRSHGPMARLEVPEEALEEVIKVRSELVRRVKETGFVFVALDLAGLRSGSMNALLSAGEVEV